MTTIAISSDLIRKIGESNPLLFKLTGSIYQNHYRKLITSSNYDRMHFEIRKNLNKELNKILNFRNEHEFWFYERKFEKDFARFCGKRYGTGLASGTAALQFSIFGSGIKAGDEVITVPFTYVADALAISNIGAKPVFVDIDPATFTIDVDEIEDSITEKTKAILAVHLYGNSCDMKEIKRIASKHNLKIIEDCAQAHGTFYQNKRLPFADIGCFSFHTTKNLSGLGDGGFVATDSKEVDRVTKILRDPLSNDNLVKLSKRTPCFLDSIQIAFIRAKLPFLERWTKRRRGIAQFYDEELKGTSVEIPSETKNAKHSYFRYAIKSDKRDQLKKFLLKHGVDSGTESYELHLAKAFQNLGYKRGDFPMAEMCNLKILYLPLNPFMKDEEIRKVARMVKLFDKR